MYEYILTSISWSNKSETFCCVEKLNDTSSHCLLEKNNKLAHDRGLFEANKNRKVRIDGENEKAYVEGQNYIQSISNNDLLLIGAVLYWGEGTKTEKGVLSLSFSNSDPLMI